MAKKPFSETFVGSVVGAAAPAIATIISAIFSPHSNTHAPEPPSFVQGGVSFGGGVNLVSLVPWIAGALLGLGLISIFRK